MSEYSPAEVQVTVPILGPMMVEPLLRRAAALRPDRPALESVDGVLTYAALLERARAGAADLAARGVRPGDRVALLLPAGEAFVVALHAVLLAGAAAVPVDLRLGERERAAQLASASAVFDQESLAGDSDPLAPASHFT